MSERPQPTNITHDYPSEFCHDFLCRSYRIHELNSIWDLVAEIERREKENGRCKFIITLDDFGQAAYTSMHSRLSSDLDDGEWLSNEKIDETWLDGGYPREDLNFEQKFTLRRLGFKHGLAKVKFDDVFEKCLYLHEGSRDEIVDANKDMLSVVDKEAYLLEVPVEYSYETIYAFPNGYFTCDLSPFENYHLAKHLEEIYDYRLIGIGASYLAFIKGARFSEKSVDNLLALLMKLYAKNDDPELFDFFREVLLSQRVLMLRYTE
ncbi:MAG: hypothetical protein E6Q34_00920 [Burkholderiaceae bacterium]|nr:MAG: hypothetical protein E6Q34_00920 [Burkholderiaceae bacterium]